MPVVAHFVAAHSAAAAAAAERKLITQLRSARALSAMRSVALPVIEGLDEKLLDRLVRSGLIGRVSGRYYLDEVAVEERAQARRTAFVISLVVLAAAVTVVLLVLATR